MIPSVMKRSLMELLLTVGIIFCLVLPVAAGEVNLSAAASLREAVGSELYAAIKASSFRKLN